MILILIMKRIAPTLDFFMMMMIMKSTAPTLDENSKNILMRERFEMKMYTCTAKPLAEKN